MASKAAEYWTPDRMKRAQPMDRCVPIVRELRESGVMPPTVNANNTKAAFVDDATISSHPCTSVGYLFFKQGGHDCNGSAYVADLGGAKDIIFTAAHNLHGKYGISEPRFICFIPGMKNLDDPPPFGKFNAIEGTVKCSKKWYPDEPPSEEMSQYDFGVVQLEKVDGKAVGEFPGIMPLPILWDAEYTEHTKWTTLAYPSRKTGVQDDNPRKKMMKQIGEWRNTPTQYRLVKKTCCERPLGHGASGGLWYQEHNGKYMANGVHIVSNPNDHTSWSPYFTKSIVPQYYKDKFPTYFST